jgi:type IV pilus assembly protein PilM
MPFRQSSHTAIGLDIGSRIVKAAQLESQGAQHRITRLTQWTRGSEGPYMNAEEIQNLKKVLKKQGFVGRRIVLAVPDEIMLRGTFELPANAKPDMIPQMARMELARMHSIAPDAFEMVCWNTPPTVSAQTTKETIAMGCPHDTANAYVDQFEQGGMDITALDVRSAAAARACQALAAAPPTITAVVDLGWCSTKLMLLSGKTIIYERLLECPSLQILIDKLCKRFDIDHDATCHIINSIGLALDRQAKEWDKKSMDAIRRFVRNHVNKMLEELTIPFTYVNHHYPGDGVQCLILIGGGAVIPGLVTYLDEHINIDVKLGAPSELMECNPQVATRAANPAATVSVGLACFFGGS